MLGGKVLLVLSLAVYAKAVGGSGQPAGSQTAYCPSPFGNFPVPSANCNQYMICHEGKATVMDCPPGTTYNPVQNFCDFPQNLHCNFNGVAVSATSAPYRTSISNITPQTLYCPSLNGHFPVPSVNCNQYMLCHEGKATVMDCPPGLTYNSYENWCDFPQNLHCNFNGVAVPATSAPYRTATPNVTPQTLYCPSLNGNFPVPSANCDQYIVCHEGKATVMDCPLGLAYNSYENWCDFAQNLRCNFNGVAVPATSAPYRTPTPNVTPQTLYCPSLNGNFPIPSANCNHYMICHEGKATVMDCPPGTAYNPEQNLCDFPQNLHCNFNGVAVPATSAPYHTQNPSVTDSLTSALEHAPNHELERLNRSVRNPAANMDPASDRDPAPAIVPAPGVAIEFNCQQSNGYHAIPNECDTYILCQGNVAYKSSCPDGLHFNAEAKWPEYACDYSPKVQCADGAVEQTPKATNDCPRQYGFFPMSDNECSKYMRCHEGILTVMECTLGLVFNPNKNACDWLENVPHCKPDVFKDFTCPDTPLEADGTLSDVIYQFRYNKECNRFLTCNKGYPRLLKCNVGMSFDEASQNCVDSAYVTNCES